MNEMSNLAGGAPPQEQESDLSQSMPSGNGATDLSPQPSATPTIAPRTITSKRVVIPPNAKRFAKLKPIETQVADAPPLDAPASPILETAHAETQTEHPAPAAVEPVSSANEPFVLPENITTEATADNEREASDTLSVTPLAMERAVVSPTIPVETTSNPYPSPAIEPAVPVVRVAPTNTPAQTRGSGLVPSTLPYRLAETELTPVLHTPQNRRRTLELALWALAAVLLVAAAIAVIGSLFPNLLSNFSGAAVLEPTATTVAVVEATPALSATATLLPTDAPTPIIPPTSAPLVLPTPPVDGTQFSTLPDASVSGWIANDEAVPHYADVNLHAGTFQGQELSSVIQFHLRNYPKDSQVLFAALELTGRDASRLGQDGAWQIELIENSPTTDWRNATSEEIAQAKSLGTIGAKLTASKLGQGRLNRFILNETELQLLEQQFQNGNVVLRVRGTASNGDNLFTWESGVGSTALSAPTLHLVLVPGQFVIVTNTPEPKNILTAAAYVVRGTDRAKKNGTPTTFPPGVATATPGGDVIQIPAETAIAQNKQTAFARALEATAFARTTGTYTPTPQGQVVLYPTPTPVVFTNISTATPIPPDTDLLTIPIDYEKCRCKGQILLLSTRFGGEEKGSPIMLAPDGTELGKLSGDLYYLLALAREPYSPDRKKKIIYPNDPNGVQQIGYLDLETNEVVILTNFSKSIAYAGAWSPDGNTIAFVSTERGNTDEIYVYDFGTQTSTRLTEAPENLLPLSKHPSWSPDGQQIVFWSTRDGTPQIWAMNRDGSNLRNISNNSFNETNPVWVK